jgi:hypothetical protein
MAVTAGLLPHLGEKKFMKNKIVYSKAVIITAIGVAFSMPAAMAAQGLARKAATPQAVGPIGTPVVLGSDTTIDSYRLAIARNASGNLVASWGAGGTSFNGPELINLREFDAQGNPLTPQISIGSILVPLSVGESSENSLAMDDNGDFVVAWLQNDSGGFHEYAQKYSSAGIAIGGQVDVADSDKAISVPSVGMDSDGDFVVAWNSDTLSTSHIGCYGGYEPCLHTDTFQYRTYARIYNADASPHTDALLVYQSPSTSIIYGGELTWRKDRRNGPSVAMDASGDFVVAFDAALKTREEIHAVHYAAGGTGQHDTLVKSFPVASGDSGTHVAMDATGNFDVLWGRYSVSSAPRPVKFYVQRYAADGSVKGLTVQDTPATPFVNDPQIFMTATDDFCVTWAAASSLYGQYQPYAQYHHANGAKNGSAVQLISELNLPPNEDVYQAAAMDANGELATLFLSVYLDSISDVSQEIVNARLFSAP